MSICASVQDALGLITQTYENSAVDLDRVETGIIELAVTAAELDKFFESSALKPADADEDQCSSLVRRVGETTARGRTRTARLGAFTHEPKEIRALKTPREGLLGIRPRNKEQAFALDLLLDDNVKLLTVVGKAGTGKTLLALAAGLRRVVDDGAYARLLVSRPVMPLGRDIGFLPGDVDQKLNPWMQPIYDNLEFLLVAGGSKRRGVRGFEGWPRRNTSYKSNRSPTFACRSLHLTPIRDRRRSAESDSARGQDGHHPLR